MVVLSSPSSARRTMRARSTVCCGLRAAHTSFCSSVRCVGVRAIGVEAFGFPHYTHLRYAPTPQAKAKIEHHHDFWQKRLPAVFATEAITAIARANTLIEQLRAPRNEQEKHREIGSSPQAAWKLALRPAPACTWQPYIWCQRGNARVDPDGRIAIGTARLRIDKPPGTKDLRCLHPDGDYSIFAPPPAKLSKPVLLLHSPAPAPVLL